MEYRLLGWPPDGPTLELDYREFSYAGKFVVSSTGKLVADERGSGPAEAGGGDCADRDAQPRTIVGATAFDEDRTDSTVLRIRYVTVRDDRQGEGIGTELLDKTRAAGRNRGYESVRIAVNNPFAYEAAHEAGFGFTGDSTGIAELVLVAPQPEEDRYRDGLATFRDRDLDLSESEKRFVRRKLEADAASPDRNSR